MADKRFNILFSGKLAEGIAPAEALKRLCVTLNQDEAQIRELFKAGFGAVILTDLEGQQAYAVRDKLRDAGAHCSVQEAAPPPPQETLSGSMLTMESSRVARPATRNNTLHHRPPVATQPANSSQIGTLSIKAIMLAVLAVACWWGYQHWLAPH
jgi:hypothetical protein